MDLKTIAGVQALIDTTPIHRWLGFVATDFDAMAGTLSISAPVEENSERTDGAGQAHGGVIATLIDSAATFACMVAADKSVPTMNIRVDYHDIFTRRGMPGIKIDLPVVVGSDIAATIATLGDGVTGWSLGDRVLLDRASRASESGNHRRRYHG